MNRNAGTLDYALLLLLAAIFGSSFMFTSIAVREIPPLTLVSGRLFIALVIFTVLLSGARLPRGRVWVTISFAALVGNALPFSLINWAQQTVDASVTAIYMAVMPLATVVLAHFVTRDEKLNIGKFVGVLLGLSGVVVLMGWESLLVTGSDKLRDLAIICAALCYAINALVLRQLSGLDTRVMLFSLMLMSFAMVAPLAFWFEQPTILSPSGAAWMAMLALGLGPTAMATFLLLLIINRQGASFLSQINFLVPLAGTFFGMVILGERLPANAWLALLLILLGILLARVATKNSR